MVKSASVAQRELIHQGRLDLTNTETRYHDGQWTDGLISAAQQVAHATGTLCEAANDTVQGNAAEERLIVSAKQVSSSTTQLVMACQVKADMDSKAFLGLKSASTDVKKATQNLVNSAQRALEIEKNNAEEEAKAKAVQGMKNFGGVNDDWRKELALKEEIEKAMREQEKRYAELKKIREDRYKNRKDEEEEQEKANKGQYKRVTGHD